MTTIRRVDLLALAASSELRKAVQEAADREMLVVVSEPTLILITSFEPMIDDFKVYQESLKTVSREDKTIGDPRRRNGSLPDYVSPTGKRHKRR